MTKDDIIRMAVESDLAYRCNHKWWMDAGEVGYELERFAALVAEHEREACAKLCEEMARPLDDISTTIQWVASECANAIRERGKE